MINQTHVQPLQVNKSASSWKNIKFLLDHSILAYASLILLPIQNDEHWDFLCVKSFLKQPLKGGGSS